MSVIRLLVAIIIVVLLSYYLWQAGKWINYKFAYESGVERTVRGMVKPECLKPINGNEDL